MSEELKEASLDNKLESLIVGSRLPTKRYLNSDYHKVKNFFSCPQTFVISSSALNESFNMKIIKKTQKDLYNVNDHLYEDSI